MGRWYAITTVTGTEQPHNARKELPADSPMISVFRSAQPAYATTFKDRH